MDEVIKEQPWFEKAIRGFEAVHGPAGGAWNISMILQCLWAANDQRVAQEALDRIKDQSHDD